MGFAWIYYFQTGKGTKMEKTIHIMQGIIRGLIISVIYLGISFIATYTLKYFDLAPLFGWLTISIIIYTNLLDSDNLGGSMKAGKILTYISISIYIIGLIYFICNESTTPPLWIYIVINSLVCLTIITSAVEEK